MKDTGKPILNAAKFAGRVLFGPWPFVPMFAGLLAGLSSLLLNTIVAITSDTLACRIACIDAPDALAPVLFGNMPLERIPQIDLVAALLNMFATGLVTALVVELGRRLLRTPKYASSSRSSYLGVLFIAALAESFTRLGFLPVVENALTESSFTAIVFRTFGMLLLIHTVFGLFGQEYRNALMHAEGAVADLHRQQRLVVEADERARRDVAAFLHDQVQANLLVVAMRVRAASLETQGATADALNEAIAELERIRADDVRRAGRRLSPDISAVGLDSALADLSDSWRSAMQIHVRFDSGAHRILHDPSTPAEWPVAIYRTIEQALLNSAAHGSASAVDIVIDLASQQHLSINIADDGKGITASEPGSGSALIDAWMAVVGGMWQLQDRPVGGAVLVAQIPTPLAASGRER